jgi:hypothetical protein
MLMCFVAGSAVMELPKTVDCRADVVSYHAHEGRYFLSPHFLAHFVCILLSFMQVSLINLIGPSNLSIAFPRKTPK